MASRRKDDGPVSRTQFRTERVVHDNNSWYFLTREGTVEGPFDSKRDAQEHLEVYVRIAESNMLPHDTTLALAS